MPASEHASRVAEKAVVYWNAMDDIRYVGLSFDGGGYKFEMVCYEVY
jgi:hypothetical protein